MNIESDVTIDQYNLESECITMSSTYYNYAASASEAKSLVSEKKDNLEVVRAEREISIREYCSSPDYTGVKPTEGVIKSLVDKDPEVLLAKKNLREAEAIYGRLAVGVSALEIKKSELDNLVKLRCNGNYVDNVAKPTREIRDETISQYNQRTLTPLPN